MISVLHGGLWKQSAKNKKKTHTKEQIGGCRSLEKWWRGSKVQTQVIGGCVIYSAVTIVNNICIFYLKVFKQVAIKSSHYKKNFGVMTMLTRLIVIISPYIQILNHYVIYLKLILYASYTSIKKSRCQVFLNLHLRCKTVSHICFIILHTCWDLMFKHSVRFQLLCKYHTEKSISLCHTPNNTQSLFNSILHFYFLWQLKWD